MERVEIAAERVARLISAQFPQWAELPIRAIEPGGWDNRSFRLGDTMTVRLPSAAAYAAQVEKEQAWLPKLAPHLSVEIPVPLAQGRPSEDFPWPWSVYRWIDGETAITGSIGDMTVFAADVARLLTALRAVDAHHGPAPGKHNFFRGGPLDVYDRETRDALTRLGGRVDQNTATALWDRALASRWEAAPVWFHGDVAWGNLLVRDGRLAAVIDFGTSGVGDPACDLAIAWTMFSGESREAFRNAVALDAETWARGRAWTLWKALITVAGIDANVAEADRSWRIIEDVLAEHRATMDGTR